MYHVCSGETESGNKFYIIKSFTIIDSRGFASCIRYIKCHILCFDMVEVEDIATQILAKYNPLNLQNMTGMSMKETTFRNYHCEEVL